MRESNTRFSLSHIKIYQNWSTFLPPLSPFIPFTSFYLVSYLITLTRPSLTSRLKIANRSFYHSAPVLWNNLPSHLVRLFITSLLLLFQTRLCLIFQLIFSLRSWKPISFNLPFLLSLYSPIAIPGLISPVLTKLRLFISHTFQVITSLSICSAELEYLQPIINNSTFKQPSLCQAYIVFNFNFNFNTDYKCWSVAFSFSCL